MSFPEVDRRPHFIHVASTIVNRRDAADRPAHVVQQSLDHMRWHVETGEVCRERAPQVVECPLAIFDFDYPENGRAVVAAARTARRNRRGDGSAAPLPTAPRSPFVGPDEHVTVPMATIFVEAGEWDTRAHALGGTSNTLLAGLAARLAQRVGRVAADGSVVLAIPVNERAAADNRANAITGVDVTVDPAPAATDLREMRAAIKQALIRRHEVPDERLALLPLVPLVPKWLFRRMVSVAVGSATSGSSNLGAVSPATNRPDGTDADYFAMKMRYPSMTRATMHRTGGLLGLLSGRAHGQVFVSIVAYQPGNSNDDLQQLISSTLNDFSLTGTMGWRCPEPVTGAR